MPVAGGPFIQKTGILLEVDAANAKYLELKNRTDEQLQLLEACWNSFLVKGFDNGLEFKHQVFPE